MSIVLNRMKGVIMLNYLKSYIKQQPLKMISYAEYMNVVLYHAQLGYYMKEGEKIGRGVYIYELKVRSTVSGDSFQKIEKLVLL